VRGHEQVIIRVSESVAEPVTTSEQRQIPSTSLFHGRREIVIVHHGQEYRLRITKADKLILTK
jgi:hemin uptake protein HemP